MDTSNSSIKCNKNHCLVNFEETRSGSEKDLKNVESLFCNLGFRVYIQKDLNRIEFEKCILQFSGDETHGDIMVLVVMSHGERGGDRGKIITSDGMNVDIENDIIR